MILTIIYFVFILGVTVFIHELGHFLFAKKFGVYVYEFSIGMGPRLFKFKRKGDETDYCIRLFPIGGYVQMAGEEIEIDENIPKEKRLQSKKWYQRLLIMVAGVMNNFLLAILILFIVALVKGVTLDARFVSNSNIKGLNDGDKIIEVNGKKVNNYDKLALELTAVGSKKFNMTVENKKGKKKVEVTPLAIGDDYLLYGYDYGFSVNYLIIEKSTNKNIKDGSTILAIDDMKIESYNDLISVLKEKLSDKKDNYKLTLTLSDKKNNISDVNITLKKNKEDNLLGYDYGFELTGKHEKGILVSIRYAFYKFFSLIEQMIFTIVYLITGKLSVKMLSGPVGIFNVVGSVSEAGFIPILSLLALISVNVGFINLLPIPAFDGGHVLFIIIEKLRGKPVSPELENKIHTVGMILLLLLMLVVTVNDIIKLF